MKTIKTQIIIFLLLLEQFSFAQQISNIHFEQAGKQIYIYYDLQGEGKYDVTVYCSTDKGQYYGKPLQKVSGAVGKRQLAGKNKEIIWDVLAEREKLTGEISFKIEAIPGNTGVFTDSRDGQTYKWEKIGNQIWMTENLNYKTSNSWWYDNSSANGDVYGRLYTYDAALTACPDGWHLPSDAEWTVLTDYLGGKSVAGGKMKEAGTAHWSSPNTGATNSSGFTALPGGYRYGSGSFSNLGDYGLWWSSTEGSGSSAWYRGLHYGGGQVYRIDDNKPYGFSVRCLKD